MAGEPYSAAMSVTESPRESDVPPAVVQSASRAWWRRPIALSLIVIGLVVAGSATAFLVRAATKPVVTWGGYAGAHGPGWKEHPDPFSPNGFGWVEVSFVPGGTITVDTSISNTSHTQSITIRNISWDAARRDSSMFASGSMYVAYGEHGGTGNWAPFHPFGLAPGEDVAVEGRFVMCTNIVVHPEGSVSGGALVNSPIIIDYTYFGIHRTQRLPLPVPIQINRFPGCLT